MFDELDCFIERRDDDSNLLGRLMSVSYSCIFDNLLGRLLLFSYSALCDDNAICFFCFRSLSFSNWYMSSRYFDYELRDFIGGKELNWLGFPASEEMFLTEFGCCSEGSSMIRSRLKTFGDGLFGSCILFVYGLRIASTVLNCPFRF